MGVFQPVLDIIQDHPSAVLLGLFIGAIIIILSIMEK